MLVCRMALFGKKVPESEGNMLFQQDKCITLTITFQGKGRNADELTGLRDAHGTIIFYRKIVKIFLTSITREGLNKFLYICIREYYVDVQKNKVDLYKLIWEIVYNILNKKCYQAVSIIQHFVVFKNYLCKSIEEDLDRKNSHHL